MAIFETVAFTWAGREYVIPPDQVMMSILKVEAIITLPELGERVLERKIPLGRVAAAYAMALRCAGARVADEEVYGALFSNEDDLQGRALDAIHALQMLMVPPEHIRRRMEALAGKDAAAKKD